jgi:phosphoribosylformimino-5-aminoimidazole carboxamide ribotide isomerase/imidazole glycerol phosphate synthase glutamine amidotransferase subunit
MSVQALVIDAGVGNLGNLVRALERLGAGVEVSRDPARVAAGRCLFLPGVGAFAPPREALRGALEVAVRSALERGAWLFGICVGFQILFETGEELGALDGLGLLPGRVTRLPDGVAVPQIGWNRLQDVAEHPLTAGLAGESFYFVHSYAPEGVPGELCLARCTHGRSFPAIAARGRVLGTQFHPERSGEAGLRLLANFLGMASKEGFLPALDLRHGRAVRLRQGDPSRETVFADDPVALVAAWRDAGVRRVHVVDLDAAFGELPQRQLIARMAGVMPVQLGGGLRDRESIAWALGAGCERLVIGSLVARDPEGFRELALEHPGRLVPALDVAGGEVRVAGWREGAPRTLAELCALLRGLPCPAVLVTDVERDGMLAGPNVELTRRAARETGLPALLSGGVRSLADLQAAAQIPEIAGAVVGRALYEGAFTVEEALRGFTPRSSLPATSSPAPGEGESGLARRVIPCLDVRDGRVVKGVRFENLADQGDPAEAAQRYAEQGADEIVFLDITAAPEGRDTDLGWVRRAAERVFIPLTVGGGVRSEDDVRRLLLAGADKVGVNSAAVEDPDLIRRLANRFGSQCVVLSVDARRRTGEGWEVVTQGGRKPTGRDALAWIREGVDRGAGEILLTSIDRDGTKDGYDLDLLAAATAAVGVPVIASGGAGTLDHLASGLAAGAAAVLAASIFHQGAHTVGEVKDAIARAGFPVRLSRPARSSEESVLPSPLGGGGLEQGGGQEGGRPGSPKPFVPKQDAPLLTSPLSQPPPAQRGGNRRIPERSVVDPAALRFDDRGLIPVVVQDVGSGAVLMLAYADRVAVERTLATRQVWFWSRSRQALWRKGETSGNTLQLVDVAADCDGDALLVRALPAGPACHRGTRTCFEPNPAHLELGWLAAVLGERAGADPGASYTARLLAAGVERIAQKVGEEGVEAAIAAVALAARGDGGDGGDAGGREHRREALVGEAADLIYHLLVLLQASGIELGEVAGELLRRHGFVRPEH